MKHASKPGGERITLELSGEVPYRDFVEAAVQLGRLVEAMMAEVDPSAAIDWTIADLRAGSAVIEAEGRASTFEESRSLGEFVTRLDALAADAERGDYAKWSDELTEPFRRMAGMVNGRVRSVRLTTRRGVRTIRAGEPAPVAEPAAAPEPFELKQRALGAVIGRITTINHKRGYHFTLRQRDSDVDINCYPPPALQEDMRANWDKWVIVEGDIRRDKQTDRPREITKIRAIHAMPEAADDYKRARGASKVDPADTRTVEDVMRDIREG